jgi:16S rRNA (cytidine1402-2'-O)-methyltransferase
MAAAGESGTLYVVSTPIGNMGDFSFRAVDVLRSVAVVLAEDTRHSRVLLDRYEIRTPTASYHEHNEARSTPRIVERLREGEDVALISDAGTPLISDPGARLVRAALDADIRVVPVPGASALLAALTASGLDAERFSFVGFLPRKGKERVRAIDEVVSSPWTTVLYEAPNRVADSLRDLADAAGAADRPAVVARELTKQFEEFQRGTLVSLAAYYSQTPPRGEVVIVVAGAPAPAARDESALQDEARALRARGLSARDVAAELTRRGASRNTAYRIAQSAGDER